jgi:hypothetical protein
MCIFTIEKNHEYYFNHDSEGVIFPLNPPLLHPMWSPTSRVRSRSIYAASVGGEAMRPIIDALETRYICYWLSKGKEICMLIVVTQLARPSLVSFAGSKGLRLLRFFLSRCSLMTSIHGAIQSDSFDLIRWLYKSIFFDHKLFFAVLSAYILFSFKSLFSEI